MSKELQSYLKEKGLVVGPNASPNFDEYDREHCLKFEAGKILLDYYLAICNQESRVRKEGILVEADNMSGILVAEKTMHAINRFNGTIFCLTKFAKDARPFHPDYDAETAHIYAYDPAYSLGKNLDLDPKGLWDYWEKVMPINLPGNLPALTAKGNAESIAKTLERATSEKRIVGTIKDLGQAVRDCLEPMSPEGMKRLQKLANAYATYLFECEEMRPVEAIEVAQNNLIGLYSRLIDDFSLYFRNRLKQIVVKSLPSRDKGNDVIRCREPLKLIRG